MERPKHNAIRSQELSRVVIDALTRIISVYESEGGVPPSDVNHLRNIKEKLQNGYRIALLPADRI